jgi:phosphatidylglycerophosphatase A
LNLRLFFLTVGFSGLSPKAPGTVGTLVSLPIGLVILSILPPSSLFLLTILISIIAVKIINIYEAETGTHDSKHIVIDELAGMWLALSLSPATMIDFSTLFDISNPILWQIILSLILFRLFDIWKPSLIGWIDREVKGGLSVMGDDLVAGLIAGILSGALVKIGVEYLT